MGRAVSKSFSPSVIIPGGAVMENKYVSFCCKGGTNIEAGDKRIEIKY